MIGWRLGDKFIVQMSRGEAEALLDEIKPCCAESDGLGAHATLIAELSDALKSKFAFLGREGQA